MNKKPSTKRNFLFLLTLILGLSSCTIGVNLTVNPDNSGTYALEIMYSDSVKQMMNNFGQDGSALEAEALSDEAKEKMPEGITVHDLKETDSSAVLAFDFKNIEDLNGLFNAMQDGPKMQQELELKGKKKYTYLFGPTNNDKNKESEEMPAEMEMFSEVLFKVRIAFPERNIYKVKNVENYTISENNEEFNFTMPLMNFEQMSEPLEFELKVKDKK